MSAHIFPPGHFNTAERLGVYEFENPQEEIIGELARTLPKLQDNNGVLGFDLDELASYHLIHYGADRLSTKILVKTIVNEGFDADWLVGLPEPIEDELETLQEVLKNSLEAGGLHGGSMALGRIALGHMGDLHIPDELAEMVNPLYVPTTKLGTERTGRFIYPREGVVMSYIGSMHEKDQEVKDYFVESYPHLQEHVADRQASDVYFDEIYVREKEQKEFFVAVSTPAQIVGIIPFE